MAPVVEVVVEPVTLGEGPHWDAEGQCLYFVSILDHTIHKYVPATKQHTKTKLDSMPTFIIPAEGRKDHFVVSAGRRVVLVKWNGEDAAPAQVLRELAEVDQHSPNNRFNDAKADPEGRLFAGTMGHELEPGKFDVKKGSLYQLDASGAPRHLVGDLDISNGLCWDLEEKAFYFVDSLEYNVRRYDYDASTGDISNPKLIFSFAENGLEGIPDGMTIDTDGNLWIANFDGSRVIKVDPRSGELLQTVAVPALQATSVTFGGAALDELYVTSGRIDRGGAPQRPPCGATFRVTGLGARGRAGVPCKLNL